MGKKCLKCGYERSSDDAPPYYACPKCGAVYVKVEAALKAKHDAENQLATDEERLAAIKEAAKLAQKRDDVAVKPASGSRNLGKCRTCGADVSKTAKVCPHCGEKKPVPSSGGSGFLLLVMIIAVSVVFFRAGSYDRGTSNTTKHNQISAMSDCERFVKSRLRAPATAEFASFYELKINGSGDGPWTVIGYVDAQNAFGAMLRQTYNCTVHYQGDTVVLDSLSLH